VGPSAGHPDDSNVNVHTRVTTDFAVVNGVSARADAARSTFR